MSVLLKLHGGICLISGNSNTTHPGIVEFKGYTYFFTHNGGLPEGTSYSRSVCAEFLHYNPDGTIQKINATTAGTDGEYDAFGGEW